MVGGEIATAQVTSLLTRELVYWTAICFFFRPVSCHGRSRDTVLVIVECCAVQCRHESWGCATSLQVHQLLSTSSSVTLSSSVTELAVWSLSSASGSIGPLTVYFCVDHAIDERYVSVWLIDGPIVTLIGGAAWADDRA